MAIIKQQTTAESTAQVSTLTSLIVREKWEELSNYLCTEDGMTEARVSTYDNGEEKFSRGQNALHLACALHPPLPIVQHLAYLSPSNVKEVNKDFQTPLHVAASWGACEGVISFLVQHYAEAALTRDVNGKTPLHLAWEGGCFDVSCPCCSGCAGTQRKIAAMKSLARHAPESVRMTDADGLTALECAMQFEAEAEVVRALKHFTSKANKRLKLLFVEDQENNHAAVIKAKEIATTPEVKCSGFSLAFAHVNEIPRRSKIDVPFLERLQQCLVGERRI